MSKAYVLFDKAFVYEVNISYKVFYWYVTVDERNKYRGKKNLPQRL